MKPYVIVNVLVCPYDLKTQFLGHLGLWADKHKDYNIWLHGYPENQDNLNSWYEKTRNRSIVPIQMYGKLCELAKFLWLRDAALEKRRLTLELSQSSQDTPPTLDHLGALFSHKDYNIHGGFHIGTEQLMWPVLKEPKGPDHLGICWVNSQAKVEQVSSNCWLKHTPMPGKKCSFYFGLGHVGAPLGKFQS